MISVIHQHEFIKNALPGSVPWKGQGAINTPAAPKSWFPNTIPHEEKPGLLGEVASSQSGAGKVYDKLRTYGKKQERAQRLIGVEQNDP